MPTPDLRDVLVADPVPLDGGFAHVLPSLSRRERKALLGTPRGEVAALLLDVADSTDDAALVGAFLRAQVLGLLDPAALEAARAAAPSVLALARFDAVRGAIAGTTDVAPA